MKRARQPSTSEDSSKKRRVDYTTFTKWQRDLDRELQTLSWLDCIAQKEGGKQIVTKLKCRVCIEYVDKIRGRKNFSDKWVVGANSVRISNVRDHAKIDQHTHAMFLKKKQQAQSAGLGPSSYAPIAQAVSTLPEEERKKLRIKFDIAHFVAVENLPFTKYPKLCELVMRQILNESRFFSLLLDGSTDTANIDNQLLLAVWCDHDASDEKIHTCMEYLTVVRPTSVTGQGLLDVVKSGLQTLGIEEVSSEKCTKLVGMGTDGAAANISQNGLKGLVEERLPWIFWMCIAHRLELAVKDALTGTAFDDIDEFLLKLYYLYEKSAKKCRELEDVVADLKQCLSFDDDGVKPVRSSGSRWISHKLNAMKRVISKFGAYTSHIAALSEDSSVKPTDRAKLRGYYKKMDQCKVSLGLFFVHRFPDALCYILQIYAK